MRLLLDTNALLWLALEPETLAPAATAALHEPSNDLATSVAAIWEVAIKSAKGKLIVPTTSPIGSPTGVVRSFRC